jgi:putative Mn2+ efflux pump MntP
MIAAAWGSALKFFTDNPIARWIAGILIFLIGWEVVKRHLKEAGRQAERAAIAVKQAEVREAVTDRQHEVLREESRNADEALAARDGPLYPTADELPDELESVVIRRP